MGKTWLVQRTVPLLGTTALLMLLALLIPNQAHTKEAAQADLQPTATPLDATAIALEKSRLETEKLAAEVRKLRTESNWFWNNGTVIAGAVVGIFGLARWFGERRDAREKALDERFQATVKDLGSEREEVRVQAAIILLNFLGPGYERFYKQIFDLSVTNLILQRPKPQNINDLQLPLIELPTQNAGRQQQLLAQALTRVFKESYPRTQDFLSQDPVSFPFTSPQRRAIKQDIYLFFLNRMLSSVLTFPFPIAGERKHHREVLDARGIYLANARLVDANLRRIEMPEANLEHAELTGADLTGADLTGADLTGADLTWSNLTRADLFMANLTGADLTGARLHEVQFHGVDLTGADLTGADLTGAKYNNTTRWPDSFTPPAGAINTDAQPQT